MGARRQEAVRRRFLPHVFLEADTAHKYAGILRCLEGLGIVMSAEMVVGMHPMLQLGSCATRMEKSTLCSAFLQKKKESQMARGQLGRHPSPAT